MLPDSNLTKNKIEQLCKSNIIKLLILDNIFINNKSKPTNCIFLQNKIKFRNNFFYFEYPKIEKLDLNLDKSYILKEYKIDEKYWTAINIENKNFNNCRIVLSKSLKKFSSIFLYNKYILKKSVTNFNLFFGTNFKKELINYLKPNQKVSYLKGRWELGRKDNLYNNISKIKIKFKNDFNFVPETYILSKHYDIFIKNKKKHKYWILKPVDKARGLGIKIISNKIKLKQKENYLISSYIHKIHLINNTKYDLRIYALIISTNPLEIYIFKEGLVRFASNEYEINKTNMNNYTHLTNFYINKKNFKDNNNFKKLCFSQYKKILEKEGISFDNIFQQIEDIVNKTIICSFNNISNCYNKFNINCFEIFGFDILIDKNYKAWLLEGNVSPSMNLNTSIDKYVKMNLMVDTLNLLKLKPTKKVKIKKIFSQKTLLIKNKIKNKNIKINLDQIDNIKDLFLNYNIDEIDLILNYEERLLIKNNFILSFPNTKNYKNYIKYFDFKNHKNDILWNYLNIKKNGENIVDFIDNEIKINN